MRASSTKTTKMGLFCLCSMFARRPTWLGARATGKEDASSGLEVDDESASKGGRLIEAEDRATGEKIHPHFPGTDSLTTCKSTCYKLHAMTTCVQGLVLCVNRCAVPVFETFTRVQVQSHGNMSQARTMHPHQLSNTEDPQIVSTRELLQKRVSSPLRIMQIHVEVTVLSTSRVFS